MLIVLKSSLNLVDEKKRDERAKLPWYRFLKVLVEEYEKPSLIRHYVRDHSMGCMRGNSNSVKC